MVKLAFVGCGGIMQEHYRHLSAMSGVKMVGHCDIIKDRAESAASRFGGEAFTEYEAMYDKVKPNAVYVAVPPYAHCGMEEAAAERGIHLFIEKPIATDRETAKRVDAAIRKAKIISSVGYCFRYYDTIQTARQLLNGKPVSLVIGTWNGGMPGVWWWRRMDKSGGQAVEQTTHMFDLMRYLCGEVSEVYAVASTGCMTKVENYNVHDSSAVTMRLKNGGSATVTSSCVCNYGGGVTLTIVTPEATFKIAGGTVTVHEAGKTTEYQARVNMYEEEDKVFIEAVRTGKRTRIKSTYADALKTFNVTIAANESIVSGLPVKP
ncbi:MAG TPA: Gfo/Idh/MocA family oxidoreductase [Candidatus Hydrogenedentes bacterium]|nr:Gfo/Idh/MocA family oxidoreductase [Candidatus Hydrogenedentota bacterium]HPC16407.1 Gfo/Idh/MocA family oxidoreductase [Candidatus Hydrogenedentota bacterium]HRT20340.1 Gfo/Idh/MocA family oxidoreductase [Candidatus Hydrogenedentota bacterium]HRT65066.1 Gfo/Idh/MocA family oxidoreductase [Candidatus Hydrogenedentota bacterium]